MYGAFFRGSRRAILIRAGALIVAIALLDWRIVDEIPLRLLYLLPMLMLGNVLAQWELAGAAALCTILAELFDGLHGSREPEYREISFTLSRIMARVCSFAKSIGTARSRCSILKKSRF
jgi:hypothetical protein